MVPRLYIMYTADLVSVIESHGLSSHNVRAYMPPILWVTVPAVLLQSMTFRPVFSSVSSLFSAA